MKFQDFISKLKTNLGVTQAELIIVSLLLLGLLVGTIFRNQNVIEKAHEREYLAERIYKSLDSLAEAEKTTFIGTDYKNNPIKELAEADTVVKKESYYPKSKKKELPKGKININSASRVELMKLPGVGEKTAMKIITQRELSPFNSIEDIQKVKGIGPKKFEKMKDLIEVK